MFLVGEPNLPTKKGERRALLGELGVVWIDRAAKHVRKPKSPGKTEGTPGRE